LVGHNTKQEKLWKRKILQCDMAAQWYNNAPPCPPSLQNKG